jgi:hypothetical protein
MTNLITAQEVIDIAFTDMNFLPGKIKSSFIEVAQEEYIRPALGDELYAALIAAAPTGDNKALVDNYLKKALAFFVKYECLPDAAMNLTSSGLSLQQAQGTVAATDKQRDIMRAAALKAGNTLLRAALSYLDANLVKYPAYKTATDQQETVQSNIKIIGGVIF